MGNILPQKRELSGDGKYWKKEADIAREKVKELEERNKVLEDALKGVLKVINRSETALEYYGDAIKKGEEALSNNQ